MINKELTDVSLIIFFSSITNWQRASSIASSIPVGACSGRSSWLAVAWRSVNYQAFLKLREPIYETIQWNLRSYYGSSKCDCLRPNRVWTIGTTVWDVQSEKVRVSRKPLMERWNLAMWTSLMWKANRWLKTSRGCQTRATRGDCRSNRKRKDDID